MKTPLQPVPDFDDEYAEPSSTDVIAFSGDVVDTSGVEWQIGPRECLNWALMPLVAGRTLLALKAHFRNLVRRGSPAYASSQFNYLASLFKYAVADNVRVNNPTALNTGFYERIRKLLQTQKKISAGTIPNYLDAFRRFYLWCTDAGFEGFDYEEATILENRVIGGNAKGVAVMSDDPNAGPLRPYELDAVAAYLRQATGERVLPTAVLAAVWLFLAFGTNPKNLWLLNEEDLIKTALTDGGVSYSLRIPRIKKRDAVLRTGFKSRPLDPEIGRLLEELIQENADSQMSEAVRENGLFERPLFRRLKAHPKLTTTSFSSHAFRWPKGEFGQVLNRFAAASGLKAMDGSPLSLTPRRLRYSFATRLVRDGASKSELADALDHTDLQHVHVYFNNRSDTVIHLDNALTASLTPHIQAFFGMVIPNEQHAVRSNDPASRIRFANKKMDRLDYVGSCGNFSFCGLNAPVACYTCRKYQAWLDAPHEKVLEFLLEERQRLLNRGAFPEITQANDLTILAVKEVIRRCKKMHLELGEI
ncbi:tyrosine-type recombinase/integrase [Collimonas sp. H4R21]|uniref:Tyrosine-type recombinase/integrase n=1 Tax=Collimonas rhizosphaerae TaxID=3126357 RepID=A0ABU9PTB5_9BURK